MNYSFEKYLIFVGIRSVTDYNYLEQDLINNIDYFKDCYEKELSPYKALLHFFDYLTEQKKMKQPIKRREVLSDSQIDGAFNAYNKHKIHIDNIVSYATKAYPPTLAEDKSYPMIWKAEHWKWFLNTVD